MRSLFGCYSNFYGNVIDLISGLNLRIARITGTAAAIDHRNFMSKQYFVGSGKPVGGLILIYQCAILSINAGLADLKMRRLPGNAQFSKIVNIQGLNLPWRHPGFYYLARVKS